MEIISERESVAVISALNLESRTVPVDHGPWAFIHNIPTSVSILLHGTAIACELTALSMAKIRAVDEVNF